MSGSAWVCPVGVSTPVPSPSWVQYLSKGAARSAAAAPLPTAGDLHGERPRPQCGPQGRVGHPPRAQLAIGRLAGVHVHERRRLIVHGDRQLERERARGLRRPGRPGQPVRERAAVQPERLEPLHLVALGGEPSEGRPRDDVIEREEPAHEDDRGRGLRPAVAHVGDAKRLIDGLAGEQHGPRAAGEDGPRVLDGEVLLDEGADEPQQANGLYVLEGLYLFDQCYLYVVPV